VDVSYVNFISLANHNHNLIQLSIGLRGLLCPLMLLYHQLTA